MKTCCCVLSLCSPRYSRNIALHDVYYKCKSTRGIAEINKHDDPRPEYSVQVYTRGFYLFDWLILFAARLSQTDPSVTFLALRRQFFQSTRKMKIYFKKNHSLILRNTVLNYAVDIMKYMYSWKSSSRSETNVWNEWKVDSILILRTIF